MTKITVRSSQRKKTAKLALNLLKVENDSQKLIGVEFLTIAPADDVLNRELQGSVDMAFPLTWPSLATFARVSVHACTVIEFTRPVIVTTDLSATCVLSLDFNAASGFGGMLVNLVTTATEMTTPFLATIGFVTPAHGASAFVTYSIDSNANLNEFNAGATIDLLFGNVMIEYFSGPLPSF